MRELLAEIQLEMLKQSSTRETSEIPYKVGNVNINRTALTFFFYPVDAMYATACLFF